MPVLLAVNNYFYRRGGAEAVFLEQSRLFTEAGWSVVPFAMRHARNLPSDFSRYFVEEIEFGETYSLLGKLARVSKVVHSTEAQRKVRDLVRAVKPDISHAHNVYHHLSPSVFGAIKSEGVPTVLTLHDLKIACPAYKMLTHDGICERCKGGALWNLVQHRCIKESISLSAIVLLESLVNRMLGSYTRNVDRFLVPSRFFLEKLVEWGWERDRFSYVPNCVDCRALPASREPGKGILYFGRLAPEKGVGTLIRASHFAGVPLSIVGMGPEEMRLRKLAQDLCSAVTFIGYRSGPSLHDAIRDARVVVVPSEWYENAPMSILEAYALGKPVIGAAIGGIPELIREGVTGWTFRSSDGEGLAAILRHAMDLPDKTIAAMGQEARRWVEADFSASRFYERHLQVYRALGVSA